MPSMVWEAAQNVDWRQSSVKKNAPKYEGHLCQLFSICVFDQYQKRPPGGRPAILGRGQQTAQCVKIQYLLRWSTHQCIG